MFDSPSEINLQAVYTVSQLNQEIKTLLETSIPIIWLEGEISNFKVHSSGHVYFSLKDKDSQIPAVMWRSRFSELFFKPQDGMKVLALGRISVFHKRGYYQFDTIKLKPAGVGELQFAFEQLKQKLYAEGLFDESHKKPIPKFPRSIGIVTSATGAAIRDLYQVLNRRFPGIEIVLNPVNVQGKGAAEEIALAIDDFNRFGKVDTIIVGRGGGSLEDLWAFNEEEVARAIFRSQIPVISAVGHEIDFTISDFVADLRAPTPSAAAELAVADRTELLNQLQYLRKRLAEQCTAKIQFERDQLQRLVKSYSFMRIPDRLREQQQRLDEMVNALDRSVSYKHVISSNRLAALHQRLSALAPESVLKRGYSICTRQADQKIVNDADMLTQSDEIKVRFYRGAISAVVEQVHNK
ncbi:MAG TPA: exodeoxyribonuclease VII large subunit [bacterium]|nr:exodeoxyribonuclease VII large subunit [bacterium]